MTGLTDRYVHATTRELPSARRDEIGRELRASIADQVDDRIAAGEPREQAEHDVIAGLGDPIRLAANYTGRPLALIGPAAYPAWRRLLGLLITIVVPIVAILAGVGALIGDDSFGRVVLTVWVAALTVTVHLGFWVTLIYAVLERSGVFDPGGAETAGADWSPDLLAAELADPHVSRAETVAGVAMGAVTIAFIVLQHWFRIDGQQLPILEPDLWSFWLPFMLIVLAAGVVLTIVIGVRRSVTWTLAWANFAVATAFAAPLIWLAVDDRLLNPDFVAHFDWLTDNATAVNTTIAVGTALAWFTDVYDTFKRARRDRDPAILP